MKTIKKSKPSIYKNVLVLDLIPNELIFFTRNLTSTVLNMYFIETNFQVSRTGINCVRYEINGLYR